MSITRREALAAAVGCGLTTTGAAGADDKPPRPAEPPRRDPVYGSLPEAIRAVFETTFPGYRCIRMAIRQEKGAAVYRGTVFNPPAGAQTRRVGEESVTEPILYHLEVAADAKIIEETPRPVDPGRLPRRSSPPTRSGTRRGSKGREHWWNDGGARGKDASTTCAST